MKILPKIKEMLRFKNMNELDKAVQILKNGGIVIFPTDTAFGIGCRIDNNESVKRLFELRKRPENKPFPVLVSSIDMAQAYSELPNRTQILMEKYWPGGLTIVLKKNNRVSDLVSAGTGAVGLRMPDNKTALALIEKVGVPILGPSANFSGEETPFKLEDVDKKLLSLVDYVLEGDTKGENLSSTIVDCTKVNWKILREGAVRLKL